MQTNSLQIEDVTAFAGAVAEEGSYTCYLFEKGLDKILKKVGEECSEVFCFHTDPRPPRMLRVDGISNVRDFGGFATEKTPLRRTK